MASGALSAEGRDHPRTRPTPGLLRTNETTTRNQRFSWQDTPLEVQRPTFEQFSSPTNSTIDESPVSPHDDYQTFPSVHQDQVPSEYPAEKPPVEHSNSPYNQPGLHGTHPAYFAPLAEDPSPRQPETQQPCSELKNGSEDVKSLPTSSTPNVVSHYRKGSLPAIKPDTDRSTLVYNPSSLAGPNAAIENHRPGQVAHPNATIDPEWKHGLCELDTLCCVGLCCPCMVYGKTQYRISRKAQKEDPTNMLGYESCNGSCGLMALACGFQCR
ncbi:MAG: hypothetical protein Q9225_005200 [Loekoesia sp. 1 TL-2023]